MKKHKHLGLLALLAIGCAHASPASAQVRTLTVDLARPMGRDTVSAGRYQVRVVNMLPHLEYAVEVSQHPEPVPPISQNPFVGMGTSCVELKAALDALLEAEREEDVPGLLSELERQMEVVEASPDLVGDEVCSALLSEARRTRRATTYEYPDVFPLAEGEFIRVTVTRPAQGEAAARTWRKEFSTGSPGAWSLTYGYAFPIYALGGGLQTYTAEADGDAFVVAADEDRNHFDAVPAVFFNFLGPGNRAVRWNFLTAGLGVDLTEPIVMLGTGITYNTNLSVSAGVAARRQLVLLGRYEEGDVLDAALTPEQLHERAFRAHPYVSVTLRFTTNPFGKSDESSSQEAKPEATPAGGEGDDSRGGR
jgi:hypothetical protein